MATKNSGKSKAQYVLEILQQGVEARSLSHREAVEWLKEEEQRWSAIGTFDTKIEFAERRYTVPEPTVEYQRRIREVVKALENSESGALAWNRMIGHAQRLQWLVMQGSLGEHVTAIAGEGDRERARLAILIYSAAVANAPQFPLLLTLRSIALDTHSAVGASDLESARVAAKAATESQTKSAVLEKQVEEFLAEKQDRINELEGLYHGKLLLEGPTVFWAGVSKKAKSAKTVAFISFCILLAIPAGLIVCYWPQVEMFIERVIGQSAGQFSFANLIVFTIPVLAYAWLLKHVSRIFVQNLALEVDAEHRRVMAATFLGLAKENTVSLEEADRALILNALFRPAPPYTGDDGPPIGIAELLRSKP